MRPDPAAAAVDRRAIVIGGGMAGLAAADQLHDLGFGVTLLEAASSVGGLARSLTINGEPIEAFYHHIFPQDRETLELLDRLGQTDRLEWHNGAMAVLHDGRVYPFDGPVDLMRFPPLSLVDRIRLAIGSARIVAARHLSHMDTEAVGTFGPRYFGRAGYELLWRPMLEAKFGPAAGDVPMAWLASRIRQRAGARRVTGDRLGYLRGSLGMLVSAFATELIRKGVRLQTAARVERVVSTGDGWRIDLAGQPSLRGNVVVAALSGQILARLVELPRPYAEAVTSIAYRGVVCVLLELDRPLSATYWVNLTDRLGLGCVAVIEHTNLIPAERYGGRHLIYLAHYVSRDDAAWSASPDELIEAVEPAFRALNSNYRRSWIQAAHLSREPFAQPVPQVGGPMPSLSVATGLPGLTHASLAHIYPDDRGLSLAIRLGRRAAREAVRPHASSPVRDA